MARRHRLFGRAARKVARGSLMLSQAVFLAWFWTAVLPVILYLVLTQPKREQEEREN